MGIPWVDVGKAGWIRVPWDENKFGFLDKVRMLRHDLTQSSEVVLKRAGVGGCPARVDLCQGGAGLVTYSVLLCWLFAIKDRHKNVYISQTHNQALHHLFLTVYWDFRAWHDTVSLYSQSSRIKARS